MPDFRAVGGSTAVEVSSLVKRYGGPDDGIVAVDGLSFTADRTAITALLGPNGAGKSTVLKVASGLLAAWNQPPIEVTGSRTAELIDELPLVGVLMAVGGGELRDAAVAAFLGYLPVPTKEERTPIQGREAPHVQKPLQGTKRSGAGGAAGNRRRRPACAAHRRSQLRPVMSPTLSKRSEAS